MRKKENKQLLKRKRSSEVGYKPKHCLLDDSGKDTLVEIINNGAICELQKQQILEGGGQTMTIKFYFEDEN